MTLQEYREEVKFQLSGGIIELELSDSQIDQAILVALREIQRYLSSTKLATIPYASCIDLSNCGVSSVDAVYRTEGYVSAGGPNIGMMSDPAYLSQWQMIGGNTNYYNLNNWLLNYASWNTMLQIRNTLSTDLAWKFDKYTSKLYVNISSSLPKFITIEYVPKVTTVEEITSDYWIDVLMRYSVALTKVTLGRVRTRFKEVSPLYEQDGETILAEGNEELKELREFMQTNAEIAGPID